LLGRGGGGGGGGGEERLSRVWLLRSRVFEL